MAQTTAKRPHDLKQEETSYLRDVLLLEDGETEDTIELRLKDEARMFGVDVEVQRSEEPSTTTAETPSVQTVSNTPRRSESINSRSTDLSSIYSDPSLEHRRLSGKFTRTRGSFIGRDYDLFLGRRILSGRTSTSSSPAVTPSTSIYSLPLASPEPSKRTSLRRIKPLSMLKLVRPEPSTAQEATCPHCRSDTTSNGDITLHRLPCGHILCTEALRILIRNGLAQNPEAVPSCCGKSIARHNIEQALGNQSHPSWSQALDLRHIDTSIDRSSDSIRRQGALSPQFSIASTASYVDSLAPPVGKALDLLRHRSDYKQLCEAQASLQQRFAAWIESQRASLETKHARLQSDLTHEHELATDGLHSTHADDLADAEDRQVKDEAELREAQAQEKRDNATALKHMEAYCAGRYSTGEEPHGRPVTDQDRAELEKTQRVRDSMETRHQSAINVLRGAQSRRLKARIQRQEREVLNLKHKQEHEREDLEQSHRAALRGFDGRVAERTRRACERRDVQIAIIRKKTEENVRSGSGDGAILQGAHEHTKSGSTSETAFSTTLALRESTGST